MIKITTSFETRNYRTPVPVRGKIIESNRFLKVSILEKDYFISVLPNFHEATLEELNFKILHLFSNYQLDFKDINFSVKFFNLINAKDVFLDSIKDETLFNIEAILLGMIKTTHPNLFTHDVLAINQLYNDKDGADFYLDTACIKIKITPHRASDTIRIINDLYRINPDMIYRLDGNRRFELDEMISFIEEIRAHVESVAFLKIDYIEEPFKNFYDTILFKKRADIPVAIDESYKYYMGQTELDYPAVIKPSLIGISPIIFWLRSHEDNRAIISSSFEHPTILVALEFIARMRPNEFHGLENFHSIP